MHLVMAGESKFLPQSLSESLRWLMARVSGAVICLIGGAGIVLVDVCGEMGIC